MEAAIVDIGNATIQVSQKMREVHAGVERAIGRNQQEVGTVEERIRELGHCIRRTA